MKYFAVGVLLMVVSAAALGLLILGATHFAPNLSKGNNQLYLLAGSLSAAVAMIVAMVRLIQ